MPLAADSVITASAPPSPARLRSAERPVLRIGVVQERCRADVAEHLGALEAGIAAAVDAGAQAVFLQELTLSRYFAVEPDPEAVGADAEPLREGPTFAFAARVARSHGIFLHASLWEDAGDGRRFNTAICVDPAGELISSTRKFHIPHFPGYHEHRYFAPGDSSAIPVAVGPAQIGFPTCWDQWFPELARTYALRGADILVYPTAIGSEPLHPDWDTQPSWQAAIVGQAVTNGVFVVAINRIGNEGELTFYGSSFVADPYGRVLVQAPRDAPAVLVCDIDLDARRDWLEAFPMLGDRRPEIYATD